MKTVTILSEDRIAWDSKIFVLREDKTVSYGCMHCPFHIDADDQCDLTKHDDLFKMCSERFDSNGNVPVRFHWEDEYLVFKPAKSKPVEMSEDQLHIINQLL